MEMSVDQLEEPKMKIQQWANKRKLESWSYGYEIPKWDQAGKWKDQVESSERRCNDITCSFWLLLLIQFEVPFPNISAKGFPSNVS